MVSVTRAPRAVAANRRHPDDPDRRLAHHGFFNSWRARAMLPYRGLLAFDFLTLAEAHPRVVSITNATDPVSWWNGREWEEYYPRYGLTMQTKERGVTRTIDVEILSSTNLAASRNRFQRIRREFREQSRKFILLTERHLLVQPRLTNCKFILSQAGTGLVSEDDRALIRQISAANKSFTLNDVVGLRVLTYSRAYTTVLNMVAVGELGFSLGRRFDADTPVWGRSR